MTTQQSSMREQLTGLQNEAIGRTEMQKLGVQRSEYINIEATGNGWIVDIYRTHCTQGSYHADRQLFLDPNELLEFVSFELSQHYLEKSSEK